MTKAAAALGWDFTVFDGAGNIGGGFATAIREAIATSPDAIVLGGIDCAVAKQPLKEARDAGITILGIDNLDCDESGDGDALFTAPMYYNEEAIGGAQYWSNFGTAAAAYIANVRPDAKILAASTWETSLDSSVYAGFTAGLDNWCPDCEIVAKVGGTSAELFPSGPIDQRYQAALVAHPETTLIYSPYDNFFGSTLSIAKGVQDAGLRDQILLMGGQGAQEGTDLLRSGDIDAEPSAVDKGWMAWGALDQLNRIFNDEEPVSQGVGPRLFDETQTEGTSGNYQTTVDYATAYKDIWKK
jgi:ribose transport system substrate-binding protein